MTAWNKTLLLVYALSFILWVAFSVLGLATLHIATFISIFRDPTVSTTASGFIILYVVIVDLTVWGMQIMNQSIIVPAAPENAHEQEMPGPKP
jgi:uncharacterized membrane protein YqjE